MKLLLLALALALPPLPPVHHKALRSPKHQEQVQSFAKVVSRANPGPPVLMWDYAANSAINDRSNITFYVLSTTNLPAVWKRYGSTTNLQMTVSFTNKAEFWSVASSNRVTHLISEPWGKLP